MSHSRFDDSLGCTMALCYRSSSFQVSASAAETRVSVCISCVSVESTPPSWGTVNQDHLTNNETDAKKQSVRSPLQNGPISFLQRITAKRPEIQKCRLEGIFWKLHCFRHVLLNYNFCIFWSPSSMLTAPKPSAKSRQAWLDHISITARTRWQSPSSQQTYRHRKHRDWMQGLLNYWPMKWLQT